jgi:hypothetical protein
MAKWALIILVFYNDRPQAITSVPGFSNKVTCTIAAGEIMEKPGMQGPKGSHVSAWCIEVK